jgi:hypothetical protein
VTARGPLTDTLELYSRVCVADAMALEAPEQGRQSVGYGLTYDERADRAEWLYDQSDKVWRELA